LIAAGGVFGLLGIAINLFQDPEISTHVPGWFSSVLRLPWSPDAFAFGPKIFGSWATNNFFWLGHVRAAGCIAVLLRAKKAGLKKE